MHYKQVYQKKSKEKRRSGKGFENTLSIFPARKLRSRSASLSPLRGEPCPLGLRDGFQNPLPSLEKIKKINGACIIDKRLNLKLHRVAEYIGKSPSPEIFQLLSIFHYSGENHPPERGLKRHNPSQPQVPKGRLIHPLCARLLGVPTEKNIIINLFFGNKISIGAFPYLLAM